MVIVDTTQFESAEEYVKSLSERGRHERKYVASRNPDVVYTEVQLNREKLHHFMQLWERQLVRGQPIQWAYPVETVCDWYGRGEVKLFEANTKEGTIGMHFLRKQDGFWEAGPPMWDKSGMTKRHLGTAMWFWTIEWGVENKIGVINLGGGIDTSWREMIRRRREFRNPLYKWRFVPESVKTNPDEQPDYKITEFAGQKSLTL